MTKLIRHIEAAEHEANDLAAEQLPCLAAIRRRDAVFLRRVLLGMEPWPEAFGPEDRR